MAEKKGSGKIFVVDDEFVIASTLTAILQRDGFDAKAFTRPSEALRASRESVPVLLISDVMMPELSGPELAIQMKEDSPQLKVLLFSGQAATANLLEEARGKGYDFELLSKPIHPAEFLQKITRVMADCSV